MFSSVTAGPADRRAARAGDELIARPDVVMDRAFTVAAPPVAVWPWLVQLGKKRAGWYLPAAAERFLPPGRRAARDIRPAWQRLAAGDVIPDYGGRDETFEVAAIEPGSALVYRSVRGRMNVTWSITLLPVPVRGQPGTRVHLRLRLGPVRRPWLARTAGEFIDALTTAGLAAGLKERLADHEDRLEHGSGVLGSGRVPEDSSQVLVRSQVPAWRDGRSLVRSVAHGERKSGLAQVLQRF